MRSAAADSALNGNKVQPIIAGKEDRDPHIVHGGIVKTIIDDMRGSVLLSDSGDNAKSLINLTTAAVNNLVINQGDGPLFPTFKTTLMSDVIEDAAIPDAYNFDHAGLLESLHIDMQRSVKANSPYMIKNVIPQPSFVYLAAFTAASLYMGNAVTGEDAGEALKSELACAAAIAKLAGMNPHHASGVFTFGGTGTNLYALKIALAKIKPKHLFDGITENDVVIVGNKASHYSQQTSANWLGIGQSNYIQVKTNPNQTTNLDDLEQTCRQLLNDGKIIVAIEAVGGTTSNMAIDNIEAIDDLRRSLVEEFKLDYLPHLHVDSVLGWVWLNFADYDFSSNPLEFRPEVLAHIQDNYAKISNLKLADSFGIDFHKTGYIPYNSSMVIIKNKEDFNLLKRQKDIMTPLFHDEDEYNPGIYTLETSRSCANILATWTTLRSFGKQGYQVLLGHALEMRRLFVDATDKLNAAGFVIENDTSSAIDIFLRCFETGIDAQEEHAQELSDDTLLAKNSRYTSDFYSWFTTVHQDQNPTVALSKSSASFYNLNGNPVVALRLYLLSINNTEETINFLIDYLINAKQLFDETYVYTAECA